MNKKARREVAKNLDQFYTNPEYARSFLSKIDNLVDRSSFDIQLEPSAGTGSFFDLMETNKRVGLDLDPKSPGILQTDFFEWNWPRDKSVITIGNPPFGKNASLAVKFFNHAAKFSDVIAFILPRTFRKASVINRLHKNFHLIYDETVPDNSFLFDGSAYNVWCCAQIWIRKPERRTKIEIKKLSEMNEWFSIVPAEQADFSIQRVGGGAGTIRTKDFKNYSKLSNYFIKAHDNRVLPLFQKVDFTQVKFNTAGNPSVSPSELIELWIEQARLEGIY